MIVASMSALAAGDGSITITASENGTKYNFYRILDLTGKDTSSPTDGTYDAVTYTVNDTWKTFISGYLLDAQPTGGSLNQIVVDGVVKYLNITESNIVDFTNAAMTYAIHNNIAYDFQKIGDGSNVTQADLPLGYYLMIPVDASDKNENSSGSVASLTSTVPSATILVKAKKPDIEKEDDTISADVGQTVTYTVTGTVPNTAGYETYKYIIKDEMTSGLTFQQDVVINVITDATTTPATKVDVTDKATIDYSVANKYSADINVFQLQNYVGKTIELTYTAIVNDNAVASSQEKNKVHLEYGHNPSDLEKTTEIEEEVYSAKIIINKYTENATTGPKLADAKFALMNSEGKFYKYTAASGSTPAAVTWVELTNGPAANTTSAVTDAQVAVIATADTAGTITTKTTNAQGAAEFPGLKDGTYYLVEFAAPQGYNRVDKAISVTVQGTDADTATGKTENVADATHQYDASQDAQADVENKSGSTLPSTGGMGTTILYVGGSILVILAAILLITKRRMKAED